MAEQLGQEGLHDPVGSRAGELEAVANGLSEAELETFIAYWKRTFELLSYARNSLPESFGAAIWDASKVAAVGVRLRERRANLAAPRAHHEPTAVRRADAAIRERVTLSGLSDPLAASQDWPAELTTLPDSDLADFVAYWAETKNATATERLRLGALYEQRAIHAERRALEGHIEQSRRDRKKPRPENWSALASHRRLGRVWKAAIARAAATVEAEGLCDPLSGTSGKVTELVAALTDAELAMFTAYASRKAAVVRSYFNRHAGGRVPYGAVGMTNLAGYGYRETERRRPRER